MIITRIKVENFRSIKNADIKIAPLSCLIGENNSGKSSILQALCVLLESAQVKVSDFYDSQKRIRIEATISKISDEDMGRLPDNNSDRIRKLVKDGEIKIVKIFPEPGKGKLYTSEMVPSEERFRSDFINNGPKGLKPAELESWLSSKYPEYCEHFARPLKVTEIRKKLQAIAGEIPVQGLEPSDEPIPTGIDKSIQPLLPEVIYIPAVKELSDEIKTSESATFGKLIGILFERVEGDLSEVSERLADIQKYLNVQEGEDGSFTDDRLSEVKQIERAVEQNLQEAFPETSVRISIPPPELKSLLSSAHLVIDDGVEGGFKSKGDGLKRSITFAILRAYVTLKIYDKLDSGNLQVARRPYVLLFEEPELFLHPTAQKQLFEALSLFSEDNQVIVTTHSTRFYDPGSTGVFIKLAKDYTFSPPATEVYHVDLRDIRKKDQFQIVCQENNDIAFFSRKVLLVEGDTDRIVFPHLARTLNPSWDFTKNYVSISQVGGKHGMQRYKNFFTNFGVEVGLVVDLDALTEGFAHLGASQESTRIHRELKKLIQAEINKNPRGQEPPKGKKIRDASESKSYREMWLEVVESYSAFKQDPSLWDNLEESADAFFAHMRRDVQREILGLAETEEIRSLKEELLNRLRTENIYVLSAGDIESYYPNPERSDKLKHADDFIQNLPTATHIRELPVFRGAELCEFDLIFRSFFDES